MDGKIYRYPPTTVFCVIITPSGGMKMKLVVCFPGIGYHCDKPLLYYGRRVAGSVGYKEYKNVEYVNRIGNVKGDPVKMQAAFEEL